MTLVTDLIQGDDFPAIAPSFAEGSLAVPAKQPHQILDNLYAFAPNRATMGGTSYLIVDKDGEGGTGNLLIDAPAHDEDILTFIQQQGGVRHWVITHRGGMGEAKALQAALECQILVQEQEAYLLPDIPNVVTFRDRYPISSTIEVFWAPGYSPGSACVYVAQAGGILFTGRHLLPDHSGQVQPLRFAKTFHWPRQLQQVERLRDRFTAANLTYICPAANTGFLRGQRIIPDAYRQLQAIDVPALKSAIALL